MREPRSPLPTDARGRPRIFFDISELLEYAKHHHRISGIQRFSLAVITHILKTYPDEGFAIIAYHPTFKRSFEIDPDWCTSEYEFNNDEFSRFFALNLLRCKEYVRRFRRNPLAKSLWFLRMIGALIARDHGFFRKRQLRPPFISSRALRFRSYADVLRPAVLRPGDRLVVLGATGGHKGYLDFLSSAVGDGAELSIFVHDLIPLVKPAFHEDTVPGEFGKWIAFIAALATKFYVNSQSTARDLRAVLDETMPDSRPPIEVVRLAHEFQTGRTAHRVTENGPADFIRADVRAAARLPYVMVVGTLEIRKNLWGVARVWQHIIEQMPLDAPRLILAGRRGWMLHDFDDLVRHTGNLGGYIRTVEMASDAELEFLYSNCLFTLYPSYYEGWGLPIGESLWLGKTCVTSNTSSMPEVAQGMCLLVDPSNLTDIYEKVMRLITDTDFRREMERRIDRSKLRRWSDVGDDLHAAIMANDLSVPVHRINHPIAAVA